MFLLLLSLYYGPFYKLRFLISCCLKLDYYFYRPFVIFWLLFNILIYAAFEITVNTKSRTRHIKLHERTKVLMDHDSINNKKWLLS
jgi:predicted membrane protein